MEADRRRANVAPAQPAAPPGIKWASSTWRDTITESSHASARRATRDGIQIVALMLWFTLLHFGLELRPLNPGRPAAALVGERVHRNGVVLELWVRAVPALQLAPCMPFFDNWEMPLEKAD